MHERLYYWKAQEAIFEKIRKYGSIQEYIARAVPDIEKAFALRDKNLRCMDERTPGGYHLAGSGILLSLEKAVEVGRKMGIESIWRHRECGAEALFARLHQLDLQKAQKKIEERAERLASSLDILYKGMLEVQPRGLHIARVVYYIGVRKFDPSQVAKLPPGFIISRRFIDPEYAEKELDISISLALGEHGFGELFRAANPFVIIPVGDPENSNFSIDKLKIETQRMVKRYSKRVIIDGFHG